MIVLDKVFRQKDSVFLRMLNEMRRGHVSQTTLMALGEKVRNSKREPNINTSDGAVIIHTKLFPTNKDVDSHNDMELRKLPAGSDGAGVPKSCVYKAEDEGNEPYRRQLIQGIKAPETLELRIGSQVMLLKNINTVKGLVNGARGVGTQTFNHFLCCWGGCCCCCCCCYYPSLVATKS